MPSGWTRRHWLYIGLKCLFALGKVNSDVNLYTIQLEKKVKGPVFTGKVWRAIFQTCTIEIDVKAMYIWFKFSYGDGQPGDADNGVWILDNVG